MPSQTHPDLVRQRLLDLQSSLVNNGPGLALFLVFDRPERIAERPGLARTFWTQRCASNAQLSHMISVFRSIGAYVELFEGEQPLLAALAEGRLQRMAQPLKVVYNGIEGGIGWEGFEPGRKALLPAVTDSYGMVCSNSNAYACALGRHKFHYFTLLRELGVRTPRTWHYRPSLGWAGGKRPTPDAKVIAKSTYESWSVGVTEASIFHVDDTCEERVAGIADEIGQPVTVQEFVSGTEVGVSVVAASEHLIPPPVQAVLAKAPGDRDAVTTIHDNLLDEGVAHTRYDGPPEVMEELYESASRAFDILELGAFARIDFRIDQDERPWVTDVGVSPGLSSVDSAVLSMAELGLDHPAFLHVVIAATLASRGRLPSSPARTRSPAS